MTIRKQYKICYKIGAIEDETFISATNGLQAAKIWLKNIPDKIMGIITILNIEELEADSNEEYDPYDLRNKQ